jgi:hypothetical protein
MKVFNFLDKAAQRIEAISLHSSSSSRKECFHLEIVERD